MLGWLVAIFALISASCLDPGGADNGGSRSQIPPPTELGGRATSAIDVATDDDPCRRACTLAVTDGCVDISAQCADGGWPLFAVVSGLAILCSSAMNAACGGSTGLTPCQSACPALNPSPSP